MESIWWNFDHDDILVPDCLDVLYQAAKDHNYPDFLGSDDAIFVSGTWAPHKFPELFGWRNYPFTYKGHELKATRAFKMNPSTLSHINTAPPDHIRVWSREFYRAQGGHDKELVILDDLDLLCRTYTYGRVHQIEQCLYLYRLHPDNT